MPQNQLPVVIKHPSEDFVRYYDVSCWLCEGEVVSSNVVVLGEGVQASGEGVIEGNKIAVRIAGGVVAQQGWITVTFTSTPPGGTVRTRTMLIPVATVSGKEWIPPGCLDARLFQWLSEGQVIRHCEQAQAIAAKALDCLVQVACCPQTPVSVDGETYDYVGYVRALQGMATWAQELCAKEEELEPFYAVNNPIC